MGGDDCGHDFVGVEGNGRQLAEQRSLVPEAIHWPLPGRLVNPRVSYLVEPPGRQGQVILEVGELLGTSGQGVLLDVADASLDDPFRFRVAPFTGDRLHAEVAAQG